ncbi:MAG: ABC transporter permease [Gemmatimonadetes bacterium]|nr:ABC transporter permease [Gemmatimonadota bacterium]
MANPLALYTHYVSISLRGQMQYRVSFLLGTVGQLLGTGVEFIGILALFDRFGSLVQWSLAEVAFFYGIVNVAFAFTDALSRGFDHVGQLVRTGEFDRMLLRPRSTVLQLIGQEFTLKRLGRFIQGGGVLLWATLFLDIEWSAATVALTTVTVICGACFFLGLFINIGTVSFWTTETLELMNVLTYGGIEASKYPLSIYRAWFRRFFTMVIPMGCVTYFPVLAILGKPDPLGTSLAFQYAAPLFGLLYFILSLFIWRLGLRHYRSTGS